MQTMRQLKFLLKKRAFFYDVGRQRDFFGGVAMLTPAWKESTHLQKRMPAELSNLQLLLEQRMKLIEESRNLNVILHVSVEESDRQRVQIYEINSILTTSEYLAAATRSEFSLITVPKQGHKTMKFHFTKYSKQMVPFEISTDEVKRFQFNGLSNFYPLA